MTATVIIVFIAFVIWALIETLVRLHDLQQDITALRREISQANAAKWR